MTVNVSVANKTKDCSIGFISEKLKAKANMFAEYNPNIFKSSILFSFSTNCENIIFLILFKCHIYILFSICIKWIKIVFNCKPSTVKINIINI